MTTLRGRYVRETASGVSGITEVGDNTVVVMQITGEVQVVLKRFTRQRRGLLRAARPPEIPIAYRSENPAIAALAGLRFAADLRNAGRRPCVLATAALARDRFPTHAGR